MDIKKLSKVADSNNGIFPKVYKIDATARIEEVLSSVKNATEFTAKYLDLPGRDLVINNMELNPLETIKKSPFGSGLNKSLFGIEKLFTQNSMEELKNLAYDFLDKDHIYLNSSKDFNGNSPYVDCYDRARFLVQSGGYRNGSDFCTHFMKGNFDEPNTAKYDKIACDYSGSRLASFLREVLSGQVKTEEEYIASIKKYLDDKGWHVCAYTAFPIKANDFSYNY